jgi:serine/threonine-protein kinase
MPGTHIGAYAIREAIGRGGAQMAYLADSSDGRQVVLKVSLFPRGEEGSPNREMHERFLRQVAFFLQLRGTLGVADVFGYDMFPDRSESGHAYLIQEWIPGSVTVLDWYRAEPHKLKGILGGWIALANACGEMTRLGICHRDLKPENILMAPKGFPKIVDFDSGRSAGAKPLTKAGPDQWPGTKRYYSPEVCRAILSGSSTAYRALFESLTAGDLHALGVIFYQVLTGRYPFDAGDDDEALFKQIAYEVPARPSALNPEVPFGLEKVTMKLLQKDPDRRYRYGGEVVAELKALLRTDEDWEGLFQTPARAGSTSSSPRTSRTSRASSPSTPRTAVGSAALNLAPSAIVLAGPSAQACREPLPRLELTHPEPVPHRRRALLLVAALALALVVPSLALGQHGGTMLFGKAKTAAMALISAAITACVGPTRELGATGDDWLAKCPPESRKPVHELRLEPDLGEAEVLEGPSVVLQDFGRGLEVRDGPVEASAIIPARGGGVVVKLIGTIQTGSAGATVHFNKMQLYSGNEDPDGPPAGRIVDICAYGSVRGYSEDLIPEANNPPPPSKRHAGFMFVVTQQLGIHFAR